MLIVGETHVFPSMWDAETLSSTIDFFGTERSMRNALFLTPATCTNTADSRSLIRAPITSFRPGRRGGRPTDSRGSQTKRELTTGRTA